MKSAHVSLAMLSGLEAVVHVFNHGSYRAAATALKITPSAVSHRIRELELELGLVLFERDGRGVAPTYEGRVMAEATDRGLNEIRTALFDLVSPNGPVVIACSTSFSVRWLMPRLDTIHRILPGVDLRISADDRPRNLFASDVDGIIRYGPPLRQAHADAVGDYLTAELVFPVCHPSLAEDLKVPNDLANHRLLHDDAFRDHQAKATWRTWLSEAAAQGAPSPDVNPDGGTRLSHAHLALEAAAAGQGVALARSILVERDLEEGRLVAPFALQVPTGLGYSWTRVRDRPAVKAFESWLLLSFGVADF